MLPHSLIKQIYMYPLQELILGKQGIQQSFNTEWNQKWVPAIIDYSKGTKRKNIKGMVKDMEKSQLVLYVYTYKA